MLCRRVHKRSCQKAKKHFKGKYLVKKDDNLFFETLNEWFEYVDASYENFLELANYVIELQTDEIKKDLEVFQVNMITGSMNQACMKKT